MKGAATIEELRKAVATLQRNDRRTRARLALIDLAIVEDKRVRDWLVEPQVFGDGVLKRAECTGVDKAVVRAARDAGLMPDNPIAFGSLFKLPNPVATSSGRSGAVSIVTRFFSRFTRSPE